MSAARVEATIAETLARVQLDAEVADLALQEVLAFLCGGERQVSELLARQEANQAECRSRLDRLAGMWMSGMLTDWERYEEIEANELRTLQDLALGIEAARSEVGRMRENARRARDFVAFSKDGFLLAAPERRRAVAKALGVRYAFYGREKRIEIDTDPILLEFASFGNSRRASLEPTIGSSGSKKEAPREEALVSGGRASNVIEPLLTGNNYPHAASLPETLVEALKGPLFPDLWAGLEGAA